MVRDKACHEATEMINHDGVTNVARQANWRILVSHKSPRGFEPGSLVAGSKQVVHWTSETW